MRVRKRFNSSVATGWSIVRTELYFGAEINGPALRQYRFRGGCGNSSGVAWLIDFLSAVSGVGPPTI